MLKVKTELTTNKSTLSLLYFFKWKRKNDRERICRGIEMGNKKNDVESQTTKHWNDVYVLFTHADSFIIKSFLFCVIVS